MGPLGEGEGGGGVRTALPTNEVRLNREDCVHALGERGCCPVLQISARHALRSSAEDTHGVAQELDFGCVLVHCFEVEGS